MEFPPPALSKGRRAALGFLALLVCLAVYTVVTQGPWFPVAISPTWAKMAAAGVTWLRTDALSDFLASIWRLFGGLALALFAAVPLGMLLTLSSRMNAMIGPIVSALRFVPPAALLPLLVILVGIGDLSKILVVAIASFFVIVPGTVDAMQKIPVNVVRVAQTLGFTGFPLIRHILIPSVLPDISRVVRGSIGLAWTYVVVSELINASNGLGFRIVVSQRFLRIDLIMVVLGCIGLIGVGSDALMFLLHRLLFPWDVPKKQ